MEILLPHLLRNLTDDNIDLYEYAQGTAWKAISWVTGIKERDPDAVWTWYGSHR